MQQSMDEIAVDFAQQRFTVLIGLTLGDLGTDDDFAVMEGDDISGSLNVHEVAMDAITGGIVDQGDFEVGEVMQGTVLVRGILKRLLHRGVGNLLERGQPAFGNLHRVLLIAENDLDVH